jgi:hypothetical protein
MDLAAYVVHNSHVSSLVQGPASATTNHILTFSNTSGKICKDSGVAISSVALLSGAAFTGPIAMGSNSITNIHQAKRPLFFSFF